MFLVFSFEQNLSDIAAIQEIYQVYLFNNIL